MKHLKSLICLLLALLILSGCAPAAPAQSDASTEPAQTEEADPTEQTEQAGAEETIAQLDEKQRQAMKRVEAVYEKNRDKWVDTLFSMIVGVQP